MTGAKAGIHHGGEKVAGKKKKLDWSSFFKLLAEEPLVDFFPDGRRDLPPQKRKGL